MKQYGARFFSFRVDSLFKRSYNPRIVAMGRKYDGIVFWLIISGIAVVTFLAAAFDALSARYFRTFVLFIFGAIIAGVIFIIFWFVRKQNG
jgi:lipopolysaccharide export LptBFGC system permease protein LptF